MCRYQTAAVSRVSSRSFMRAITWSMEKKAGGPASGPRARIHTRPPVVMPGISVSVYSTSSSPWPERKRLMRSNPSTPASIRMEANSPSLERALRLRGRDSIQR